jgi:dienelactone hydrolase
MVKKTATMITSILTLIVFNAEASSLKNGKNTVEIESGDKLGGYHDIISGKKPPLKTISANLYLPSSCGGEKIPAVIIQHGSGNPDNPWYSKLAKALNEEGIIAIVPDSFKTRGLKSTASDQSKLSKATRLYDTFSTFRYLQGLECVDPDRVGVTGYSFGGIISLDSVEAVLADRLGNGHSYKASLPVYPSCQTAFENTKPTATKVHILAGGADDYTPAKYCVDGVKTKKAKGWDIDITVLEGAHHGFNYEYAPEKLPEAWTFGACGTILIDDDGYETNKTYKATTRDGWSQYVRTMAASCGKRGVTLGGSKETAKKTLAFTVSFFKENL